MRRRDLLLSLAQPARPNILYIMTDQQHAGMMSCTGNPWLKTPQMDSIATGGTRFELAYSANPVCMPARTSMMTGRYPSYFGMRTNGQAPKPPRDLSSAMGNVFRAAGYTTAFGGKTHWPKPMTPESLGFEYISADERDDLADACATFLRKPQAKPWLLVASFINPHDICYMAIDAFTKATKAEQMHPKSTRERECVADASRVPAGAELPPLPANAEPTSDEPAALGRYGGFRGWARKNWTAADWRLHRWAYCRLTERVDAEIGKVLAALRASGQERNTVIVFASDHGDMDAAHGFEHKSLPYEESARVPFVVHAPGRVPAGRVDRKHLISSTVDLLPTLCDFAGIPAPAGLPGRSVKPLAETGKAPGWRTELVIECADSRTLRSANYKYSVFQGPGRQEMLIDMRKDLGEMVNLAGSARHKAVVAQHRRRLREMAAELDDDYGRALLG